SKAADRRDAFLMKPLIHVPLATISLLPVMDLQRGNAGMIIAFDSENDTVNPEAEPADQAPVPAGGIGFSLLDYVFVHPRLLPANRSFRRCENAPGPRWKD